MSKDAFERKKSMAERGSKVLAVLMRLLSLLQLLAGAGYIAVAVMLQFPPGDSLTLGLWAIGCLAIITAICGFFGGCRVRCCLTIYTVLAVLATLAQAGFVLYLFITPDKAEDKISQYQKAKEGKIKDNLHEIITIGRWVLLGLLGAQMAAIVVASVLRCCTKHRSYEEFQDEEQAAYEARRATANEQLEQLKTKLGLVEQRHVAAMTGSDSAGGKRAVSVTGSPGATERARARTMRAALFERSDVEDGKLEADMEAGKITSRVATDEDPSSNPFDSPAPQPSPSAWPQATTPSPQRSFKPTWNKASKRQ